MKIVVLTPREFSEDKNHIFHLFWLFLPIALILALDVFQIGEENSVILQPRTFLDVYPPSPLSTQVKILRNLEAFSHLELWFYSNHTIHNLQPQKSLPMDRWENALKEDWLPRRQACMELFVIQSLKLTKGL